VKNEPFADSKAGKQITAADVLGIVDHGESHSRFVVCGYRDKQTGDEKFLRVSAAWLSLV
jgi:hypothetical protein